MHKSILTIAAIVFAVSGLATAGNIANITQSGPGNSGAINQSGDQLEGYITQTSTPGWGGNTATIDQTGLLHDAMVTQTALEYSGGHITDVDQSGGNNNWAEVDQYGHDVMSADVDQIGNNNIADIWSYRNGGVTNIYQEGDENQAYQNRDGASCNTIIEQIGFQNLANQDIGIGTPPKNSSFTAIQHGNENIADQDMYGTNWLFAPQNNHGTITQTGDLNYGFQEMMGGSVANPDPVNNTAQLTQTGDSNWSTQSQQGAGHNSNVAQIGNSNVSNILQSN